MQTFVNPNSASTQTHVNVVSIICQESKLYHIFFLYVFIDIQFVDIQLWLLIIELLGCQKSVALLLGICLRMCDTVA